MCARKSNLFLLLQFIIIYWLIKLYVDLMSSDCNKISGHFLISFCRLQSLLASNCLELRHYMEFYFIKKTLDLIIDMGLHILNDAG